MTVAPYVGATALAPLLERAGRCVYVLCRTSNPGAGELQDLVVGPGEESRAPGEPLYLRVARLALAWQATYGTVGLVVGATAPAELAAVRRIAPGLPFLVPGVGAAATPPTSPRPGRPSRTWLPGERQPRHPAGRQVRRRMALLARPEHQVLQLPGAGIGGAAQTVHAAARPLQQGFQGRGADVPGRLVHGVGAKAVEQGGRVASGVVLPMSPRLASAMNGTSAGTLAGTRSSAARPADPKASKKARLTFTAAAYGSAWSSSRRVNRSPAASLAKPRGKPAGSGSRPRHRSPVRRTRPSERLRIPPATRRAARRGHGPLGDGPLEAGTLAGGAVGTGVGGSEAGVNQAGLEVPSSRAPTRSTR